MPFNLITYVCECVLVFMFHPSSCPPAQALVQCDGGRSGRRRRRWGVWRHPPSCPFITGLPETRSVWFNHRAAALMLPGPANQFAFPSSKGKQPHLQEGCAQLHITHAVICACMQMDRVLKWRVFGGLQVFCLVFMKLYQEKSGRFCSAASYQGNRETATTPVAKCEKGLSTEMIFSKPNHVVSWLSFTTSFIFSSCF